MGIVRDLYMARKIGAGLKLPAPTVASLIKRLLLAKILYSDTEKTETGVLIHIEDALAEPAIAAVVDIAPIQNLNGYDRPWPAGGGVNQWDEEWETGRIDWTGNDTDDPNKIRSKGFMPVSEGNVYRVVTSNNLQFFYYDSNKSFVSYEQSSKANQSTITIPAGCAYIRFYTYGTSYGGTYKNDISINYPSSVTTYSPYSNICPISGLTGLSVYVSPTQDPDDATVYNVEWSTQAGTVYGGTLDVVTGLLTVDMAMADLGTLNWTYSGSWATGHSTFFTASVPVKIVPSSETAHLLSSAFATVSANNMYLYKPACSIAQNAGIRVIDDDYTDAASFKAAMSGVQLCYELATPLTYQLTAQEVQMLLGENYIWSSSGDSMSVTYLADGNATPLESLNLMLGNRYSNPGTVEDVSDREALEILLGR